jgi:hypothetical protein
MSLSSFRTFTVVVLIALFAPLAGAHQSVVIEERYRVTVGFVNNPAYAGMLNHLDLIIRTAESEPQFVEGLAESLSAELMTPDGTQRLRLTIRAVRNRPGYYTADFIPTVAGNYSFRVWGFIGEVEFDEIFDRYAHNEPFVQDPASISLP